jgi:hypothetical protein
MYKGLKLRRTSVPGDTQTGSVEIFLEMGSLASSPTSSNTAVTFFFSCRPF